MKRLAKGRFFYGWAILVASFLVMFIGSGRIRTFGLFFDALHAQFGWSPTVISSLQSANAILRVIATLLGGWLVDRVGARPVIIVANLIANVSMGLLSRARNLGEFYVLYALSGAGGPLLPLAQAAPQRWFRTRRGLVLGIVTAGGGIGGFIFPPMVSWVIPHWGWGVGFLVLAAAGFSAYIVVWLLMVESPEKMGLAPYGASAPAATSPGKPAAGDQTWSVAKALRTRSFPLLCLSLLFTTIPSAMLTMHFFPYMSRVGIPTTMAATAFGAVSIVGIVSRLGLGSLSPGVLGWKRALMLHSSLSAASFFILVATRNVWTLWLFVIAYGTFSTARSIVELGIVGDYYGTRSLTTLLSFTTLFTWAGQALGPLLGGVIYESTGSYTLAFLVAAIMLSMAALVLIPLKPPFPKTTPQVVVVD